MAMDCLGSEKSSPLADVRSPREACSDAIQVRGDSVGRKASWAEPGEASPNHFLMNCHGGGGT